MSDRAVARRPAPRAGASRAAPAKNRPSAFIRGSAGMAKTDEEIQKGKDKAEQRRAQQGKPFRFYVPVGETRQFIICDDAPDFFMYEHALRNAEGQWGRLFAGCIKEHENCPLCQGAERESYYMLALTIVDLTPFETKDGNTVEFSRKLLIVKPQQQKKFLRFFQREGTLRGALFEVTRDGEKDAQIGNDIEFKEWVEETEMETYYREWKDREGKKHEEFCSEPYVYEEIFDEPTMESLLALSGGEPSPGSRAANARELGRGRGRGGDRDDPPARGRTTAPARGRRGASEDGWEDGQDDREYGKGRAAPTRGRGRAEPDDDAQDDDPPARPARGRPAPARGRGPAPEVEDVEPRAPRRGRAAPAEDADDAGDDAPPPRRGRAAPAEEPDDDAPPPRRAAGRRAPPADDDGGDDAPPPRRGVRRAAEPEDDPEPPRRGRTRAEPQEEAPAPRRGRATREEPEDADDAPPPRRGAAARPAARPTPRAAGRRAAADEHDDDGPPFD